MSECVLCAENQAPQYRVGAAVRQAGGVVNEVAGKYLALDLDDASAWVIECFFTEFGLGTGKSFAECEAIDRAIVAWRKGCHE